MSKKLSFDLLDQENYETGGEQSVRRWPRRNPQEVVQMSLRMPVETYDRFRALCKRERRTNGDMLRILMEGHLSRDGHKD